jgi:type III secretory pathway component EscS
MVATVENSMHQWLNVTLIVGGGLVIVGVIVGLLSSLANAGSS